MKLAYQVGRGDADVLRSGPVGTGYEYIESTTRGKPLYNNCYHVKYQGHSYPYLYVIQNGTSLSRAYYCPYARMSIKGSWAALGQIRESPWGEFDAAQRTAWWSMQPRYESEIQMLNFLLELKDFKTLAKMFMKLELNKTALVLRRFLTKLRGLKAIEKSPKIRSMDTLADITRTAAEIRLLNEFAIKPLINDCMAIFTQLAETVELAQQMFADRGQSPQTSHYSEHAPVIKTGAYLTGAYSPMYMGTTEQRRFTATWQFSYKYKMRRGWDLFKRGMGLEFDAETLWNGIPFSFIFDYFYGIGNAIHAMKTDPNVQASTFQYCESILQTRTSGISMDTQSGKLWMFYCPTSLTGVQFVPLVGYTATLYRRRVMLPNKGAALPRPNRASSGQLWNLAALIRMFFS